MGGRRRQIVGTWIGGYAFLARRCGRGGRGEEEAAPLSLAGYVLSGRAASGGGVIVDESAPPAAAALNGSATPPHPTPPSVTILPNELSKGLKPSAGILTPPPAHRLRITVRESDTRSTKSGDGRSHFESRRWISTRRRFFSVALLVAGKIGELRHGGYLKAIVVIS
jgi:hypothetical protein